MSLTREEACEVVTVK